MEIEIPAHAKCKTRYVLAVLSSVGLFLIYGFKVGLHVVIVSMVNHTALALTYKHTSPINSCHFQDPKNGTKPLDGPFIWSRPIQAWLITSYFFGFLLTQLPAGRLSELYSAKWVFFSAVLCNVVAILLSPILSSIHYSGLLALRVFQGLGSGMSFPACHVLIARWAPPMERSVFTCIVYGGTSLGTVVFLLGSRLIVDGLGWAAVFYIEGGVACVWLILWGVLIADKPIYAKYISKEERQLIHDKLSEEDTQYEMLPPMPWKAVFASAPFWAVLVAHTCANWGWYLVLNELPWYMSDVMQFNLNDNYLLTSVPFFMNWLFVMLISKCLDVCRERSIIDTSWARKIATLFASVIPLFCFIVLSVIECQRSLAVALITIAVICMGGMFCGFLANHIDISPNYAGTLMGITNTVATIPGIVVPLVVGTLTYPDPSIKSWRIIFYITIVLYSIEIIFYTIFGSGRVQKWNSPLNPEE